MMRLAVALATSFGAGYIPVAPGTCGSAVGLLLWWLLPTDLITQSVAVVMLGGIGVWSASMAERHFGGTDPGPVVIDEVMGVVVTLWGAAHDVGIGLVGFVLFRLFDVVKPYPANRFEQLHGGLGIMADDAMAGAYANVALRICLWGAGGWLSWAST